MDKKHHAKRSEYNDSTIMDALDAVDYNINEAAKVLGLNTGTLRNWIIRSDNLSAYIKHRQAEGAMKAREKLEYMLDNLDPLDPRQASVLKDICKTLMDKYEPDLSASEVKATHELNTELNDKINELLGDD
jgi:hypothetical protein